MIFFKSLFQIIQIIVQHTFLLFKTIIKYIKFQTIGIKVLIIIKEKIFENSST